MSQTQCVHGGPVAGIPPRILSSQLVQSVESVQRHGSAAPLDGRRLLVEEEESDEDKGQRSRHIRGQGGEYRTESSVAGGVLTQGREGWRARQIDSPAYS